jgi:hypothetical protein
MSFIETGSGRIAMPEARYILPEFEERTSYGFKRHNPYTKLFEDRIVFLGVQVDDASADDIMAQLLVLESQDPDRDITMYINSPGGSFTALTAIYDTMEYIKPQIQTVCLGQAASAAAVLLAAGAKGKRLALPNARILIHQPGNRWWRTGPGVRHRDSGCGDHAYARVARGDSRKALWQAQGARSTRTSIATRSLPRLRLLNTA